MKIFSNNNQTLDARNGLPSLLDGIDISETLIQHLQAAVVVHNSDTKIVTCNQKASELLGLSYDQLLGKTAFDPAWYFMDQQGERLTFDKFPVNCVMQSKSPLHDYTIGINRPLTDDVVWVNVSAVPIFDDDNKVHLVIATFMDISEQVKAKNRLYESEARYRSVIDALHEGLAMQLKGGDIVAFNPVAERILGLTVDQLQEPNSIGTRGQFIREDGSIFPSEDHPGTLSLRTGKSFNNIIMGILQSDESIVWISVNSEPLIHDGEHEPYGSVISFTDIPARKQAEDELRLLQQRLLLHRENNPLGVIEWNPEFEILDWNKSATRIFGFKKEEVVGQNIYKNIIPESTRSAVDVVWDDLINNCGGRRSTNENITKDGRIILCEWYNTPLVDEEGKVIGVASIVEDVTERNKTEQELRLYSLVLKNSSEGMMITDSDNKIIAINPAFTQITGYEFEEVKDKNPSILNSGRHDCDFYKSLWHELTTTGRWQGEIWDKRKDGEVYAKWLTINTINNDDGTIQRYIALFSDITEKKHSEELIWKQANFDALTNLPNRNTFHDRLKQGIGKSDRTKEPLALLLIDLDQFKEVNDTLGHDVGDRLLQEAGKRILECVRTTDTVARLGGDEFTIILTDLHSIRKVEIIAQKIIDRLADVYQLGGHDIHISGSIGITIYPDDADNIDFLVKNADQAMYVAKKKGRNRFSYFTQSLQVTAQNRLNLKNDLRLAILKKEFSIYFQPIIELSSGKILKAEVLLRWLHPTRGLVGPNDFISLTEETGLINDIGDWVFRESVSWIKRWKELIDDNFQISINMSPVQFRTEDESIATQWSSYLNELGLSGANIVIEITENLLLHAESNVIDKLYHFRDAGIQVAIDDFGTGYSSLAYLKKFDIDILKIDQTFVRNLETGQNDIALSEAIIVMAHKLGLKVVAEGVETDGQRRILTDAGCDFVQGHLYSKAIPPNKFEKILKSSRSDATR